jgi:hypothetical protein
MAHAHEPHLNRLLRGEILSRWVELTVDDVQECGDDGSKLIDALQARYGYSKLRAQREVQVFLEEFRDRLRLSS